MTDFRGVVEAWRQAPVTAIHPLRSVSDEAYWESGRAQALQAAQWIREHGEVMDFGCGDGRLSIPLAQMGFGVYAVDASPEMLRRLTENIAPYREQFTVTTACSSGEHLMELFSGDFDAVVCRAVLIHHSHVDAQQLIEQFTTILKPGGVLICDWPTGAHYVRQNWTDVTTWLPEHRAAVADSLGLTMLDAGTDAHGTPSVWRKNG